MNQYLATIVDFLLLFPEDKDKSGVWLIISLSGSELLFESGEDVDCLF